MKNFIVLVALFFVGLFYGQEPLKSLTKEDVPLEVANAVDVSTLVFVVDTEPQFPGGISEFRKEFSKNFNTSALKKSQLLCSPNILKNFIMPSEPVGNPKLWAMTLLLWPTIMRTFSMKRMTNILSV